jgi:hypothetical protein
MQEIVSENYNLNPFKKLIEWIEIFIALQAQKLLQRF